MGVSQGLRRTPGGPTGPGGRAIPWHEDRGGDGARQGEMRAFCGRAGKKGDRARAREAASLCAHGVGAQRRVKGKGRGRGEAGRGENRARTRGAVIRRTAGRGAGRSCGIRTWKRTGAIALGRLTGSRTRRGGRAWRMRQGGEEAGGCNDQNNRSQNARILEYG